MKTTRMRRSGCNWRLVGLRIVALLAVTVIEFMPASAVAVAASTQTVAGDIRDIRPPYELPAPWLLIGGVAAAMALALAAAALIIRHRSRSAGIRKTLQDATLDRLQQARPFMQRDDGVRFSLLVSQVIRSYVEQRFDVEALHRTTTEFLRDLMAPQKSRLRPYEQTLSRFLYCCDLAKFAQWTLGREEMEALLASAEDFVRDTGAQVTPDNEESSPNNERILSEQPTPQTVADFPAVIN